ncbi:cellulase [Alcaligenaceae bacterium]|nr:cellulase [Alcaligenaceae bacterium]
MSRLLGLLALLMAFAQAANAAAACGALPAWHQWERFQEQMVSEQGRVVDQSDPRQITTSEGQSYAMFFALVNNDRVMFRRLLRWTESHLAQGDLTAHLPSWLWGQAEDGDWKVLDDNTASDSNLWIAYSLLEAGRLWNEHGYTVLGTLLLQRMAREEVVLLPGFGHLLLPGKSGFVHDQVWRFNPSYLPPQLMARARHALEVEPWVSLSGNTERLLMETSPHGVAPDWVSWVEGKGWKQRAADESVSSYDAIRVYLWVGMLHPEAPAAAALKAHFKQAVRHFDAAGLPPEEMDIAGDRASGVGPVGFSAAWLPLLDGTPLAQAQLSRLEKVATQPMGYYDSVLALFGLAWHGQRYQFDATGRLIPAWTVCR